MRQLQWDVVLSSAVLTAVLGDNGIIEDAGCLGHSLRALYVLTDLRLMAPLCGKYFYYSSLQARILKCRELASWRLVRLSLFLAIKCSAHNLNYPINLHTFWIRKQKLRGVKCFV